MSTKSNKVIGEPMNRVDGKLKVTGAATYSAEYKLANTAYAFLVTSTIANGTIKSIDTEAAENAPGHNTKLKHICKGFRFILIASISFASDIIW